MNRSLGDTIIQLEWEQPLDGLDLGKSVVGDPAADSPWGGPDHRGQIVLAKAETIDLQAAEGLSGLQPIDPAHDLMERRFGGGCRMGVEFHRDWELPLIVTESTSCWRRSRARALQGAP